MPFLSPAVPLEKEKTRERERERDERRSESIPVATVVGVSRSLSVADPAFVHSRGTARRRSGSPSSLRGRTLPEEREREREKSGSPLVYVRWLSAPVIKYGASEGSQHARASAPLRTAREFPPSPDCPSPATRTKPSLKPRSDQSSEFIYLIVKAGRAGVGTLETYRRS
jgi:hypothetical protein